jgi:ring-1,2-phenylacetyl-CoA epoxidase subunit PaaD
MVKRAASSTVEARSTITDAIAADVRLALASVDDPEYAGISIVSLGMIESVVVDRRGRAVIELVPTYAGCPALELIARDVIAAAGVVAGVNEVELRWRRDLAWTPDRLRADARVALAREFTVVLRRKDGTIRCPVCGSDGVVDQSEIGPTRCRSVAWCPSCRNPVEVLR